MRASGLVSQPFHQLFLECWRNRVLKPLGFVMDFVPLHAENLGQHAFDEVVADDGAFGDFAALRREPNVTVAPDRYKAILRQSLQGKCNGRSGDGEPMGEGGRYNR